MITAHLNGEIVNHYNSELIKSRHIERNEKEKRCKYGVQFLKCDAWINYCNSRPEIKSISSFGACTLSGCNLCPCYKKRVDAGNTEKEFKITGPIYRKLSSAAHYIVKESRTKTLFLVLTFPKFKNDEITEQQANECFSRFMENCKKVYKCEHYLAVRERGEEGNRLHFHLVISIPFVDFRRLNRAWCNAISDFCEFSPNAIQSRGTNRVIKNPTRAIRYICKYISKSFGQKSKSRLYFISNSALSGLYVNEVTGEITRHSKIKRQIGEKITVNELLKDYKGIFINTFEHCTTYKITEHKSFNRFCLLVLYPLFDMQNKSSGCVFNAG